jgi:hypothetical protein
VDVVPDRPADLGKRNSQIVQPLLDLHRHLSTAAGGAS